MNHGRHEFRPWPATMSRRQMLRLGAAAGAGLLLTPLVGCGSEEDTQGAATSVPTVVPPRGFFNSDGVWIHYETWGEGKPIVLLHGFASNLNEFVATNWIETLKPVRRVVCLDGRGHGRSDKPHEPQAYGWDASLDVLRLIDHLGIEKADLMGWSLGGYTACYLLAEHQERFTSVVLGSIGTPFEDPEVWVGTPFKNSQEYYRAIADAMLAEDPSTITNVMKPLRAFVDSVPGNDREALAASMMAATEDKPLEPSDFADVNIPTLIVVGDRDVTVRKPEDLKAAIPEAEMVTIPDSGHGETEVDERAKNAVLEFLSRA